MADARKFEATFVCYLPGALFRTVCAAIHVDGFDIIRLYGFKGNPWFVRQNYAQMWCFDGTSGGVVDILFRGHDIRQTLKIS